MYTNENIAKSGLTKSTLVEEKSIEVGNIFPLGTKYPEALGLRFRNEKGAERPIFMGSYGIGLGRLIGTIVETQSDEKGIVWPPSVAPFRVHVVELSGGNEDVRKEADELYRELTTAGIEVLYDDRNASAGEKFADSDLLGIPLRVIVSPKTLAEGEFECVTRTNGKVERNSMSELLKILHP